MEDINIKSTALKYVLDNGYGFSGWKYSENNNIGNVILVQNKNFTIVIYYRSTEKNSHLPQDSVGLFITKDDLQFAIADGVSIVENTIHNKSGLLSYHLINSLPISPKNSLEDYISKISSNFIKTNNVGASTFIYGRLKKRMNKFILDISLVADPSDTGLNKIFTENNKEIEIINKSYGFIPNNYFPDNLSFELKGQFKLAFYF